MEEGQCHLGRKKKLLDISGLYFVCTEIMDHRKHEEKKLLG